jgi:hypothetical protein
VLTTISACVRNHVPIAEKLGHKRRCALHAAQEAAKMEGAITNAVVHNKTQETNQRDIKSPLSVTDLHIPYGCSQFTECGLLQND